MSADGMTDSARSACGRLVSSWASGPSEAIERRPCAYSLRDVVSFVQASRCLWACWVLGAGRWASRQRAGSAFQPSAWGDEGLFSWCRVRPVTAPGPPGGHSALASRRGRAAQRRASWTIAGRVLSRWGSRALSLAAHSPPQHHHRQHHQRRRADGGCPCGTLRAGASRSRSRADRDSAMGGLRAPCNCSPGGDTRSSTSTPWAARWRPHSPPAHTAAEQRRPGLRAQPAPACFGHGAPERS